MTSRPVAVVLLLALCLALLMDQFSPGSGATPSGGKVNADQQPGESSTPTENKPSNPSATPSASSSAPQPSPPKKRKNASTMLESQKQQDGWPIRTMDPSKAMSWFVVNPNIRKGVRSTCDRSIANPANWQIYPKRGDPEVTMHWPSREELLASLNPAMKDNLPTIVDDFTDLKLHADRPAGVQAKAKAPKPLLTYLQDGDEDDCKQINAILSIAAGYSLSQVMPFLRSFWMYRSKCTRMHLFVNDPLVIPDEIAQAKGRGTPAGLIQEDLAAYAKLAVELDPHLNIDLSVYLPEAIRLLAIDAFLSMNGGKFNRIFTIDTRDVSFLDRDPFVGLSEQVANPTVPEVYKGQPVKGNATAEDLVKPRSVPKEFVLFTSEDWTLSHRAEKSNPEWIRRIAGDEVVKMLRDRVALKNTAHTSDALYIFNSGVMAGTAKAMACLLQALSRILIASKPPWPVGIDQGALLVLAYIGMGIAKRDGEWGDNGMHVLLAPANRATLRHMYLFSRAWVTVENTVTLGAYVIPGNEPTAGRSGCSVRFADYNGRAGKRYIPTHRNCVGKRYAMVHQVDRQPWHFEALGAPWALHRCEALGFGTKIEWVTGRPPARLLKAFSKDDGEFPAEWISAAQALVTSVEALKVSTKTSNPSTTGEQCQTANVLVYEARGYTKVEDLQSSFQWTSGRCDVLFVALTPSYRGRVTPTTTDPKTGPLIVSLLGAVRSGKGGEEKVTAAGLQEAAKFVEHLGGESPSGKPADDTSSFGAELASNFIHALRESGSAVAKLPIGRVLLMDNPGDSSSIVQRSPFAPTDALAETALEGKTTGSNFVTFVRAECLSMPNTTIRKHRFEGQCDPDVVQAFRQSELLSNDGVLAPLFKRGWQATGATTAPPMVAPEFLYGTPRGLAAALQAAAAVAQSVRWDTAKGGPGLAPIYTMTALVLLPLAARLAAEKDAAAAFPAVVLLDDALGSLRPTFRPLLFDELSAPVFRPTEPKKSTPLLKSKPEMEYERAVEPLIVHNCRGHRYSVLSGVDLMGTKLVVLNQRSRIMAGLDAERRKAKMRASEWGDDCAIDGA